MPSLRATPALLLLLCLHLTHSLDLAIDDTPPLQCFQPKQICTEGFDGFWYDNGCAVVQCGKPGTLKSDSEKQCDAPKTDEDKKVCAKVLKSIDDEKVKFKQMKAKE